MIIEIKGNVQGSVINHIRGRTEQPTPEVGMGATYLQWTDRDAYTIIEVSKSGKRIVVQADKAIRTDANGMSESQDYTFERNPDGKKYILSLRKNGQWREVGGDMKTGRLFAIGYREKYHDYSF